MYVKCLKSFVFETKLIFKYLKDTKNIWKSEKLHNNKEK